MCATSAGEALEALAEPVPDGAAATRTMALARELDMAIGVGLIERAGDGGLFNAYVFCQPDGSFACHRKLHAFESEHIRSGDRYTVIDLPLGVRIGVLICYDNNLVENARATALLGADILIAPHQTGGCDTRSPFAMGLIDPELWREREANPAAIEAEFRGPKGREWLLRWLPSRAHDNGLFLVFSNGVGEDDGEVRTGNAMIVDCYGRIIAETWEAKDKLVVAEADLDLLPLCTGRRWLRARRPELYGDLDPTLRRRTESATGAVLRSAGRSARLDRGATAGRRAEGRASGRRRRSTGRGSASSHPAAPAGASRMISANRASAAASRRRSRRVWTLSSREFAGRRAAVG